MLEAQFIFLGTGEPRYEAMLKHYAARWPERISVHLGFTERIEHRLMAGADVTSCRRSTSRAGWPRCEPSATAPFRWPGGLAGWPIPSRTE